LINSAELSNNRRTTCFSSDHGSGTQISNYSVTMAQAKENENDPRRFTVLMEQKEILCNRTGEGPVLLIFTHGAGGTITSDGIANFSAGFSKDNTSSVICFQGNMNLKSRIKMFDAVHDNAIQTYKHETPIALGGRSMGARAAVLAAMEDTKCLILASYPLHTDKEVRDQILLDLPVDKDVLFISGDQDAMCDLDRLNEVREKMNAKTWLVRVRDADHGMNVKPKKATQAVGEECGELAVKWLHMRNENKTEREVWWGEDDQGEECVHSGTWEGAAEPKKKGRTPGKPAKEKDSIAAETTGRTSKVSDTRRKTKALPARTKHRNSLVKGSQATEEVTTEPGIQLRRSKRRKTRP
jgi:predicted alpha/beta-hydrolase family hydrolase